MAGRQHHNNAQRKRVKEKNAQMKREQGQQKLKKKAQDPTIYQMKYL